MRWDNKTFAGAFCAISLHSTFAFFLLPAPSTPFRCTQLLPSSFCLLTFDITPARGRNGNPRPLAWIAVKHPVPCRWRGRRPKETGTNLPGKIFRMKQANFLTELFRSLEIWFGVFICLQAVFFVKISGISFISSLAQGAWIYP